MTQTAWPHRSWSMYAKNRADVPSVLAATSSSAAAPSARAVHPGHAQPPPAPRAKIRAIDAVADDGFYLRVGKRFLDIVLGTLLLFFCAPILLLIVVLVRVDSAGSALYRSTRVGRGGVPFRFWKLRSMVTGAENGKADLDHLNEVEGPVFKLSSDPRTTRVGRFLRRWSLDELPQLVHVVRGQMSLVGPRPPEPEEVLQYEPWQLRRLSVKPGLTCLWQVSGRSLIGFDEWMKLDLAYVENRSFRLDLWILLRTIPAVVSGRGAY